MSTFTLITVVVQVQLNVRYYVSNIELTVLYPITTESRLYVDF